ncbi:CHAP domain-containing protein [Fluviispira sanaruensis]|uniref:Peptidase C51 domain-containing protein n=1 Tax=Fluviispira sanaruensis TaxID=2493639 RepID=A0A4P2VR37_FLUSA|nr:CHAP domain-containing protein [Fluviispira sanaruensis]BBH54704.1 hypothetical protein JCM31447_31780 [Fluviispira sanaruensis]
MYKIFIIPIVLMLDSNSYSATLLPPAYAPASLDCSKDCETPYGKKIGISYNTEAFSNCNSKCITRPGFSFKKENTKFIKDVWIGLPWQCVEYARRWILTNQKVEFEDVDFAYEIWNRKKAINVKSGRSLIYENFENGNSEIPAFGDILIYDKSEVLPYGHVAIIVNIDKRKNYIDVAEENFQNKMWENYESYSRRIKIKFIDKKYFITDESYDKNKKYTNDNVKIIGWKRLNETRIKD